MRVIRSAGQNVSPSDDGRLYNEAFLDGLFEETTIASLGSNVVSIDTLYGIMCGRDFTAEAQNINVELPEDEDTNGYIYVEFDTTTDDVISIGSALAPFTPVYSDINTTGTVCQMVIAEYTASAVAVTSITPVYKIATTKPNNTLVGSMAQFETSPATATHAVGTYIIWNNQLYKVISSISVGETLVVGSNISATSVGSEISDLKSDIARMNRFGTWTGIVKTFSSANQTYVPPSDGFLNLTLTPTGSGAHYAYFSYSSVNFRVNTNTTQAQSLLIPVKDNVTITCTNLDGCTVDAWFIPFR